MDKNEGRERLKSMSLGDHLEELRYRLMMAIGGVLVGLVGCLFFGRVLLRLIASPYESAMAAAKLQPELQAIQLPEQFMVYLKTCLVFGLLVSAPWVFYHAWAFVSSGLYHKERKFIYAVAPASAALFIAGAFFFMLVIAPLTMIFFITFETGVDFVQVRVTLQSYISFVLSLTLIFGLAFQMPIAIIFAERMGLVTTEALGRVRKFVIIGLVIVAAIVTPPDVISQIALALPLYALFEASIVICRLLRKHKE